MENVKDQYKGIPQYIRLLMWTLPALVIGACTYFSEGQQLELDLEQAIANEVFQKGRFDRAKNRVESLPELDQKLAFTQDQLRIAKQKLPDRIPIDEVLAKVSTLAKDSGTDLVEFDPGDEIAGEGALRYVMLPIKVQVGGRYEQIAIFLDRLVHLDNLIHVEKILMTSYYLRGQILEEEIPKINGKVDEVSYQNLRRKTIRVKADVQILVYRSLQSDENNNGNAPVSKLENKRNDASKG